MTMLDNNLRAAKTVRACTMVRAKAIRMFLAMAVLLVAASMPAQAQAQTRKTTIREFKKVIRTYPFSDPNPIANPGRIYPYFRFDGYTDSPVDKEWTVIELENEFLKVRIMPEIGGKIWSAMEKLTGRDFIYNNHVVKFRDIAMRGPWTSGGIEPNYGIIGHTPNCATPVDYLTRTNADGSASVIVGVLDLLTRTSWRLEITLPADAAYFTTRSFWHNATPQEEPYYTWMNTGIKAAGNLQLIYPGNRYLGHDGEFAPWPMHPSNGKNLSFYEQNNFGGYKSYHVFGRYSDFFGAYWHDDDFGMGRYSTRDDKAGKKAWIWGLSRQGMIWEKLLTDEDGQYVEVQSGRLFNQSAEGSTYTPFKHRGFAPYSSDTWTEFWFPVKGIKGFVQANEYGALNVQRQPAAEGALSAHGKGSDRLTLRFSPHKRINAPLVIRDGNRIVHSVQLSLAPMQTWTQNFEISIPPERLSIIIGDHWLEYREVAHDELSRPVQSPRDFDWGSVYGRYLKGKEWMRQREYGRAQTELEACLGKDPNFLPALIELSSLRYRSTDYLMAWDLARQALAIDTYDPAANFAYGLAAVRLKKTVDALDGFEIAALSPEYRNAAWTELAKIYLRQGDLDRGSEYASRAVANDKENLDAFQMIAVIARLRSDRVAAIAAIEAVEKLDPLHHIARFERYLLQPDESTKRAFVGGIKNELPHETFLEIAAWYWDLGQFEAAKKVLEFAPTQAEVLYWLAYIQNRLSDPASRETLRRAEAATLRLIFPFRSESVDVMQWAMGETTSWRPKYLLALIRMSRNDLVQARRLLVECKNAPEDAFFYAARAKAVQAIDRDQAHADVRRAAELDPREWRYGKLLTERLVEDKAYDQACETIGRYVKAMPDNYILGMLHAKVLLLSARYNDAGDVLSGLHVLPYEGATEGRALYRETHLMQAVAQAKNSQFDEALDEVAKAREWPENLGSGKPYFEDVDERLEDWLRASCQERMGRKIDAARLWGRLAADRVRPGNGKLLVALAMVSIDKRTEGEPILADWVAEQSDPRLTDWGRRVFFGERPGLPVGVTVTEDLRVIAAWFSAVQ